MTGSTQTPSERLRQLTPRVSPRYQDSIDREQAARHIQQITQDIPGLLLLPRILERRLRALGSDEDKITIYCGVLAARQAVLQERLMNGDVSLHVMLGSDAFHDLTGEEEELQGDILAHATRSKTCDLTWVPAEQMAAVLADFPLQRASQSLRAVILYEAAHRHTTYAEWDYRRQAEDHETITDDPAIYTWGLRALAALEPRLP